MKKTQRHNIKPKEFVGVRFNPKTLKKIKKLAERRHVGYTQQIRNMVCKQIQIEESELFKLENVDQIYKRLDTDWTVIG